MMRIVLLPCLWGLLSLSLAQLVGPLFPNPLTLTLISKTLCYNLVMDFQTDTEEGGAEEEVVELFTTPRTKLGAATSDFGYNLFRTLAARDPKASVLLSPISISAAFTQLSLGEPCSNLSSKSHQQKVILISYLLSCKIFTLQLNLILKGLVWLQICFFIVFKSTVITAMLFMVRSQGSSWGATRSCEIMYVEEGK